MPLSTSTRMSGVLLFKRAWGLCVYCLINSWNICEVAWEIMMSSVLNAEEHSFKKTKQVFTRSCRSILVPRNLGSTSPTHQSFASDLWVVGTRDPGLWSLEQSFAWTEVDATYMKRDRKDLKFLEICLCLIPTSSQEATWTNQCPIPRVQGPQTYGTCLGNSEPKAMEGQLSWWKVCNLGYFTGWPKGLCLHLRECWKLLWSDPSPPVVLNPVSQFSKEIIISRGLCCQVVFLDGPQIQGWHSCALFQCVLAIRLWQFIFIGNWTEFTQVYECASREI